MASTSDQGFAFLHGQAGTASSPGHHPAVTDRLPAPRAPQRAGPCGVAAVRGSAVVRVREARPVRVAYLARSNWNQTFRRAAEAIGLPSVRPHELRHTGATLAAATGATTKELMRRLGHSSPAAALVYQHAADDRDGEIARALAATVSAASGSLPEALDARKPSRRASRS